MSWDVLVTLPARVDSPAAEAIGEELRSAINCHPAVLIADMSSTVVCDHAGAEVMIRAYQHAVVSGTQFRLVAPTEAVRNVLKLSGLGHLVHMYPSLTAAANGKSGPDEPLTAGPPNYHELLDRVIHRLFAVSLGLQAMGVRQAGDGQRITEVLQHLNETIDEIRDYAFITRRLSDRAAASERALRPISRHRASRPGRGTLKPGNGKTPHPCCPPSAISGHISLQRGTLSPASHPGRSRTVDARNGCPGLLRGG